MLKRIDPATAYKRVDFEAYVAGSDAKGLVRVCFEDIGAALERALWADGQARTDIRHNALQRAQMGLLTLLSGLDMAQPVSKSLEVFYRSMVSRVTNAMRYFDPTAIAMTRDDLADIRRSLFPADKRAA
ncbi:flagellar protein FliS [Aurantiacibacter poecillastricola]|uniref:flagellar protein FliS n=1 Tax=Aurantiacibacter poecillastricola TaxID=3064385 RepID=UPI00273FC704|nr:flagellar protein FliS [Aurantiacibacter sp. 219JJ12-13]MDP5263140.1 flagellar protein FliS [Aurantiacibacter sp. 219JJ12-13]